MTEEAERLARLSSEYRAACEVRDRAVVEASKRKTIGQIAIAFRISRPRVHQILRRADGKAP